VRQQNEAFQASAFGQLIFYLDLQRMKSRRSPMVPATSLITKASMGIKLLEGAIYVFTKFLRQWGQ
jgi:hypothetical protein